MSLLGTKGEPKNCEGTVKLYVDKKFLSEPAEGPLELNPDVSKDMLIRLRPAIMKMMGQYKEWSTKHDKVVERLEAIDNEYDELMKKLEALAKEEHTKTTLEQATKMAHRSASIETSAKILHQVMIKLQKNMESLYVCYKVYKTTHRKDEDWEKIILHKHITPKIWMNMKMIWARFHGADFEWEHGYCGENKNDQVDVLKERLALGKMVEAYEDCWEGQGVKEKKKKNKKLTV